MDCIKIIHISDLHFGENKSLDLHHQERLDAFYRDLGAIRSTTPVSIKFHVAITGDFVDRYDANPELNDDNFYSFKQFISKIIQHGEVPPENFIFCLGNHDKSQRAYKSLLDELRKKTSGQNGPVTYLEHINGLSKAKRLQVDKESIDDKLINDIILAESSKIFFNPYPALEGRCPLPEVALGKPSSLVGTKIIDKIKYLSFNSSWFCAETIKAIDKNGNQIFVDDDGKQTPYLINIQDHGNLSLGKKISRSILDFAKNSRPDLFTVGLIHHNIRSLAIDNHHEKDRDSLLREVYDVCSIILSGHEHGELDSDMSGLACYTFCSGTFFSKADAFNGNTFSTIDVLFDTQQVKKTVYRYNNDVKAWQPQFAKGSAHSGNYFEFPKIINRSITNAKIASNDFFLRMKNNVLLRQFEYEKQNMVSAEEFLLPEFAFKQNIVVTDFKSLRECNTLQAYVEQHTKIRAQVFKKIYEERLEGRVTWKEPLGLD